MVGPIHQLPPLLKCQYQNFVDAWAYTQRTRATDPECQILFSLLTCVLGMNPEQSWHSLGCDKHPGHPRGHLAQRFLSKFSAFCCFTHSWYLEPSGAIVDFFASVPSGVMNAHFVKKWSCLFRVLENSSQSTVGGAVSGKLLSKMDRWESQRERGHRQRAPAEKGAAVWCAADVEWGTRQGQWR